MDRKDLQNLLVALAAETVALTRRTEARARALAERLAKGGR